MSSCLEYLVIHCTATEEGVAVTDKVIRRWHTAPVSEGGRGWRQVGYSKVIYLDGTVVTMVDYNDDDVVDPWEITNGVAGLNYKARHIVYVGGLNGKRKPKDTRTPAQHIALEAYVREAVQKWPNIRIAGHNQFANKACPCFDVPKWLRSIGIAERNIAPQKR